MTQKHKNINPLMPVGSFKEKKTFPFFLVRFKTKNKQKKIFASESVLTKLPIIIWKVKLWEIKLFNIFQKIIQKIR